jgi:hypothetical protein
MGDPCFVPCCRNSVQDLMEDPMRALSPTDGSADAVREAADAALAQDDNRLALERELDRLNAAIQGSAAALGQHLSWLIMAQAFLLTAYVIVLVGAWSLPLPGKRWLLTGIAVFAMLAVSCTYLGLRAARDRVGPLKLQRQRIEDALERVAARPPAFARQGTVTALLAQASTRGLPLVIVAGWIALTLYTLSLPLPTDNKAPTAASESRSNGSAAPVAKAPRPATTPGAKTSAGVTVEASAAPTEPATTNESPLLDLFRRAVNTPPAAEPQEGIKP